MQYRYRLKCIAAWSQRHTRGVSGGRESHFKQLSICWIFTTVFHYCKMHIFHILPTQISECFLQWMTSSNGCWPEDSCDIVFKVCTELGHNSSYFHLFKWVIYIVIYIVNTIFVEFKCCLKYLLKELWSRTEMKYYICRKGICVTGHPFNINEVRIHGWENDRNSVFFCKVTPSAFWHLRRDDTWERMIPTSRWSCITFFYWYTWKALSFTCQMPLKIVTLNDKHVFLNSSK